MVVFKSLSDPNLLKLLQQGAVGVLPTDTIYGIVCQAGNPDAVARLYKIKHRDHKPGTVIAANIDQLEKLGIKRRYLKAVEHLWPNSLSIEIPNSITYLNQATGRQAFRIPLSQTVRRFLEQTGPLLTSSANQPGQNPAATIKEAQAYFGDEADFYVDGGDMSDHKPSTIIRIVDDAIEVLREGAVKIDEETGKIL